MSLFEILTIAFSGCSALAAMVSVIKSFFNGKNIRSLNNEIQLLTDNITQMQTLQNNIQIGIDDLKLEQKIEERIEPIRGALNGAFDLVGRVAVAENTLKEIRNSLDKVTNATRELELKKTAVYLFDGVTHFMKTEAVLKPECFITPKP